MAHNIDYWEKFLQDLPRSYRRWFEEERKYLHNEITPGSSILEVGCGEGRSIFDVLPVTSNVTGIDNDEKAIEMARSRFSGLPGVKLMLMEASDLKFKDDSFDYVLCINSFVNFADEKYVILEEMKRVLKKSGKIIISVFSEDAFEERMSNYKKFNFDINKVEGTTVYFGDVVSEQFSKQQLEKIFAKVGLKVDDIKKLEIVYICKLSK